MIWAYPIAFIIPFIAIGAGIYLFLKRRHDYAAMQFIDGSHVLQNWKTLFMPFIPLVYCLAIALLGIALARPQMPLNDSKVKTEGIDIVLAIDISPSMLARDFQPNRLGSAKQVAKEFIESRPNDRIGLVLFAGEAFTHCPLTIDHDILIQFLEDVNTNMLKAGTAIGSGLGTAINRLKDSPGKSKVVLLMTDGENNSGEIDPTLAANLAKEKNVRVHTIGVGTIGEALSPVAIMPDGNYRFSMIPVKIDEELLQYIAETTSGEYFRATNNEGLKAIYDQIDSMEKTRIELSSVTRMEEKYFPWLMAGVLLICIPFILQQFVFKTVN